MVVDWVAVVVCTWQNHVLCVEVDISEYSELYDILNNKWVKFSGDTKESQLCIWIDEGE